MPLSDRENQILQDIERQLFEQDPKFADQVGGQNLRAESVRNIKRGLAVFLAGFGLLVAFFLTVMMLVGVVAFLVMVVGATYAFQNIRRLSASQKANTVSTDVGLMSRVEHRIRDMRRRDETE